MTDINRFYKGDSANTDSVDPNIDEKFSNTVSPKSPLINDGPKFLLILSFPENRSHIVSFSTKISHNSLFFIISFKIQEKLKKWYLFNTNIFFHSRLLADGIQAFRS